MSAVVTISLISHTNVGKTTLARTLLRRDVGEVLDQPHVTDASQAYTLLETPEAALRLWDTPGFGDSARLLRRLRGRRNPVGWLLSRVWDRLANRALYCSQEAARNVRDQADVVLYLANAAESPVDAGYVRHELDLLEWMGQPVIAVLNQTAGEDEGEAVARWREFLGAWSVVRDVLPLDAFCRCWVQEGALLSRVTDILPDERRVAMAALVAAWHERNLATFAGCVSVIAEYLAAAANDAEPIAGAPGSRKAARNAFDRLAARLQGSTQDLMEQLVSAHGLGGRSAERLQATLDDVIGPAQSPEAKPGLWGLVGAAASGALGGLAADVVSGGLSFGGGAILGAISGLLLGAGAAKGYEMVRDRGEKAVRWTPDFLDQLVRQSLLRYLAVAHFGRGRGDFRRVTEPAWWRTAIDTAVDRMKPRLDAGIRSTFSLEPLLDALLRDLLRRRYPDAEL